MSKAKSILGEAFKKNFLTHMLFTVQALLFNSDFFVFL